MHETVCQLAAAGEDQQSFGVEIEPPDVDPAPAADARQLIEHAGPAFRIVTGDDLPFLLVVDHHSRGARGEFQVDRLAVHPHAILRADALPDMGRLAIDAHPSGDDPVLQLAPRAEAGLGQHFVQLLRLGLDDMAHGLAAAPAGAWPTLRSAAVSIGFRTLGMWPMAGLPRGPQPPAPTCRLGPAQRATLALRRQDPSPVRFP